MSTLNPASLVIGGKRSRRHSNKGKRKGNKSLTSWVAFVKKVAREERLPYGKAMKRASVRKNKGEKWMTGGDEIKITDEPMDVDDSVLDGDGYINNEFNNNTQLNNNAFNSKGVGGRRRRGTKRRGSKKRRSSRRRHH